MKYAKDLYQWLKLHYCQRRCYTSIEDLPILTWFKIHESQDLTLLYKGFQTGFVNLQEVWERIYNEYIKRIGLNPEYLKYLDNLKRIGLLQYDCVINPTPLIRLQLEQEKLNLKEKETLKGENYNEIIAKVSKSQGYPVWKVSVLEFYSYIKVNGR